MTKKFELPKELKNLHCIVVEVKGSPSLIYERALEQLGIKIQKQSLPWL